MKINNNVRISKMAKVNQGENPLITVVVPVYQRPARLERLIKCLAEQDFKNYEVYFIGDCCPNFEEKILDPTWQMYCNRLAIDEKYFYTINLPFHFGGWGYAARNFSMFLAAGKYITFVDSDDIVEKTHLKFLYSHISVTDNDWMYYNYYDTPRDRVQDSQLIAGEIGHSSLCIKTEFYRSLNPQDNKYGHDFRLVQQIMRKTKKYGKCSSPGWTYRVMSSDHGREKGID